MPVRSSTASLAVQILHLIRQSQTSGYSALSLSFLHPHTLQPQLSKHTQVCGQQAAQNAKNTSRTSSLQLGFVAAAVHSRSYATASSKRRSSFALELPGNPFGQLGQQKRRERHILYRAPFLLWWRFAVRAKVFTLLGFAVVAVYGTTMLTKGDATLVEWAALGAVLVGCVVTSYCIWFYSGRYICEMSLLLPERNLLRVSVLDFWGNRKDIDVPLKQLDPPFQRCSKADIAAMTRRALMPLRIRGLPEFYLSIGLGKILDRPALQDIFYGLYQPQLQGVETTPKDDTNLHHQTKQSDVQLATGESAPQDCSTQPAGAAVRPPELAGSPNISATTASGLQPHIDESNTGSMLPGSHNQQMPTPSARRLL